MTKECPDHTSMYFICKLFNIVHSDRFPQPGSTGRELKSSMPLRAGKEVTLPSSSPSPLHQRLRPSSNRSNKISCLIADKSEITERLSFLSELTDIRGILLSHLSKERLSSDYVRAYFLLVEHSR